MGSIRSRIGVAAGMLIAVGAVGTTGYWILGGGRWSLLDCAYFVVITPAAVGYEETLPVRETAGGVVFTMVLIVSGSGILLYFLSSVTAFIVEGDLQHLLRRRRMDRRIRQLRSHIVVCGAGGMGRAVAQEFLETGEPFVVIDSDPAALERMHHEARHPVLYVLGDATADEILVGAGIANAAA